MCQEPFTQMVHKYQNLVFSICVKMTGDYFAAEDLTQETFLSAYRHKEEFDGKNEKAWLCRKVRDGFPGNFCIFIHLESR